MDNMQNILFTVALAKNPELPQVRPSENKPADKRDDFRKMMNEHARKEQPTEDSVVTPQVFPKADEDTEVLQELAAMQIACANLVQNVIPAEAEVMQATQQTASGPMQEVVFAPVQTQFQTAESASTAGQPVQTPEIAGAEAAADIQSAGKVAAETKPSAQSSDVAEAQQMPQAAQGKPLEDNTASHKELGDKSGKNVELSADVKTETKEDESKKSVFSHVDSVPVKVSDTAEPVKVQKPQNVESQVVKELEKAITAKQPKIELQLNPSNLGKITIEMTQNKDGTLFIALHAETREVRAILERGLSEMQNYLQNNTRQEVQVQVPRQEDNQQRDFCDQHRQEHQKHQQEQRQPHKDSDDFMNQLRLGLVTAAETVY